MLTAKWTNTHTHIHHPHRPGGSGPTRSSSTGRRPGSSSCESSGARRYVVVCLLSIPLLDDALTHHDPKIPDRTRRAPRVVARARPAAQAAAPAARRRAPREPAPMGAAARAAGAAARRVAGRSGGRHRPLLLLPQQPRPASRAVARPALRAPPLPVPARPLPPPNQQQQRRSGRQRRQVQWEGMVSSGGDW